MALTAKLDKATYAPGDTMTLTVKTATGERNVDVPVTVQVDVAGLGSATATAVVDKPPLPIVVTDPNRVWALVSDDETTAVYTSVA